MVAPTPARTRQVIRSESIRGKIEPSAMITSMRSSSRRMALRWSRPLPRQRDAWLGYDDFLSYLREQGYMDCWSVVVPLQGLNPH